MMQRVCNGCGGTIQHTVGHLQLAVFGPGNAYELVDHEEGLDFCCVTCHVSYLNEHATELTEQLKPREMEPGDLAAAPAT